MDDAVNKETPKRKMPRWKLIIGRLALMVGSLAISLAILEIGTRMFTTDNVPLLMKDPEVGLRFKRSFSGDLYDSEARRNVFMRTNRDGFRGPDRPLEKPAGVRRVAVLGDSMIAAVGVEEQDTLCVQLEKRLNESHPDHTWEVLNFGVNASSPGQELVLYQKLVAGYQPDIVICAFFVENDLADNSYRMSSSNRIYLDLDEEDNLYQRPFSAQRAVASQWLNRYSRFYLWQKRAQRNIAEMIRHNSGRDRT